MSTTAIASPAALAAALPAHIDGGTPATPRYPATGGFPPQAFVTWTPRRG